MLHFASFECLKCRYGVLPVNYFNMYPVKVQKRAMDPLFSIISHHEKVLINSAAYR